MATFGKVKLSGSSDGKGIKVAATSSPGTLIHTAVAGTADWDEVWVYCMNTDAVSRELVIEFGGTADPDNLIKFIVAPKDGVKCIVPGFLLQNGAVVRAFCATGNVLVIYGFVNRITA